MATKTSYNLEVIGGLVATTQLPCVNVNVHLAD